jgi:tetratricopeptide (TPR) repeat protein
MPIRPLFPLALLLLLTAAPAGATDTAALIQEGEAKLAAGEVDAGLALFEQAGEQDPKSSLVQTRIGGAHLLAQRHDQAIQSFRQAIMLDGANAAAFIGMALAYLHQGDYALARASLEEAKRIDPAKQAKIDEVIAYIDQREESGDPNAAAPPSH